MCCSIVTTAQENGISVHFFDGVVVSGYVDKGGFMNFTGPNVSYVAGNSRVMVGMLPSLRFKEDSSKVKNAFITPNLGMGVTFVYKKMVVQIPLYYNSKTTSLNGKWVGGIGFGLKMK